MKTEQELKVLFGNNIKQQRKRKNWSQEELAEKIGVSRNTVSDIEKGQDFVGAKTLLNLAVALDTEVYELFKPEGVLPDKPADIIAKYTEEIKVTVGKIGNVYIENMKGRK